MTARRTLSRKFAVGSVMSVLAGVALVLLGALPAAAAPPPIISMGFAGYNSPKAAVTATVQFKVPKLACSPATPMQLVAPVVYINDTGSPYYIAAEVTLTCTGTTPGYTAIAYGEGAYMTSCAPGQVTGPVAPGNTVVETATAGTPALATIRDLTTGATVAFSTGACGVGAGPPWIGMCAPSPPAVVPTTLPDWCDGVALGMPPVSIPKFGKLKFTHARVNGATLGSAAPVRYNMMNFGFLEISTGLITPSGLNFTTTWHHA